MDEVHIDIDAPADRVFSLVSDVTNYGHWSSENTSSSWIGGATGPAVGARFRGWNRGKLGPIPAVWMTVGVVRRLDPGRVFSFDVPFSGARWTYEVEPTDAGCRLTERREILRVPAMLKPAYKFIGGQRDQAMLDGMNATVAAVKKQAEASAS
jgi:hypothetical protein